MTGSIRAADVRRHLRHEAESASMMLSRIDRVLSRKGDRATSRGVVVTEARGPESAGLIGERFETIQDSLDQMVDMARDFSAFEALLGQLRQPLEAEFQSRRDNHVELLNLRTAHAEIGGRMDAVTAEARALAAALTDAEGRAEELSARNGEHTAALQDARLETDRLRSELSQCTARAETLETSQRAADQRIRELEQDQDALRVQLRQAETLRTELEGTRTQLQRDHALVAEENAILRRRIDEVGAEIAALARTSAANEGLLATERARASSEQGETARAMRVLETQLETARAEIAALSSRLDTATARANGLEGLNTDQATRLADLQTGQYAAERRAEGLQITVDRAMERVKGLEAEAEDARQRLAGMEVARLAAVDRAETLSKAAATHDKAIARAEDRMLKIQAKLSAAQDDHHAKAQGLMQQIAALRAELERAQAEGAMSAAALEAARRERGARSFLPDVGSVQAIVA